MLVAVHVASRVPAPLAQGSNGVIFATLILSAATTSNIATYSLNQMDANLEWNVWEHPHVALSPRADSPRRRDLLLPVRTNR